MTRTSDRTRVAEFIDAAEDLLGSSAQKTHGRVEVVDGVLVAEDLRYHTHLGEIIVSASPSGAPMLFDREHQPISTYTPESDLSVLAEGSSLAPMSLKAQRMVNPYRGAAWARWRLAQTWDYYTEMVPAGRAVSALCAGVLVVVAATIIGLMLNLLFLTDLALHQWGLFSALGLVLTSAGLLSIGASFRERLFRAILSDLRSLGATYVSDFDLSTPRDVLRRQITDLSKEAELYFMDSKSGRAIRAHVDALNLFEKTVMASAKVLHEGTVRHAYITTTGYAIFDVAEIPLEGSN